jgi:methionyl-tRNA formyltransferase
LRVVFMGSPEFAVPSLEQLVLNGYEVAAVYVQPDRPAGRGRLLAEPPVKSAALKLGLTVIQPETLRTPEVITRLAAFTPDVIVVCAYGQILPKGVLEIPPYKCLNVHFSLLPKYRGASPVAAALLAGDEFSGVTIMLLEPRLDTGPVLAQAAVGISPADDAGTLTSKLGSVGASFLLEALTAWRRNEIRPFPQDENKATYFSQIKKGDGLIDWSLSAPDIARRVRAFNPWPGCYTMWRGKQLKILAAEPLPQTESPGPGLVALLPGRGDELIIGAGKGALKVLRLQLEGKKAVSAAEFLRGQRNFIGEKLPN